MNLEILLYNILSLTGYDVYPEIAPQNKPKPFIIYNVTNDNRINGLNGFSETQDVRFQVDVYATSYIERKTTVDSIKNELELSNLNYILYNTNNSNSDGKTYRTMIDIKLWSNN